MQTIDVCGRNNNFSICEKSNHKKPDGEKYIYPAHNSDLDPTTISSYSIYNKTVVITNEGDAIAIGDNSKSQISGSLPKQAIKSYMKIELRDAHNQVSKAVSAVCGNDYTLYIISSEDENMPKQLAYSHSNLARDFPVILNIGEVIPASIYGGYSDCAAITTVGSIIYIHESFFQTPSNKIDALLLPENEKAVSIACCYNFVIVLSISGRVYASKKEPALEFTEIPELIGKDIKSISGIYQHCLAVSKDGKVYVRGDDVVNCGFLGLGENKKSPDEFKEITSLSKFKITEAYAGTNHSLFKTDDGQFIGCGDNRYGQLLLSIGPCKEKTFKPTETIIKNAEFCIAADCTTAIFKNCEPPMSPNKLIKKH